MRRSWIAAGGGAVAAMAVVLVVPEAGAADWTTGAAVEVSQSSTDNVRLAPDGQEEGDTITGITPSFNVRGVSSRMNLALNYSLTRLEYWRNPELSEFRHRARGSLNTELVEDFFFFDSQLSVSETFITSQGAISGNEFNDNANRGTVATWNASPYLRYRLGSFADSEIRYRYSTTLVDSNAANDEDTHLGAFRLDSGRDFTVLSWGFNAEHAITASQNQADIKRTTVGLDLRYAVNTQLSLLGTAGYEDINDASLADQPSGLFWNVGFDSRPGPRTALRATYGQRYESQDLNVRASYNYSSAAFLVLTYAHTLETSGQRRSDLLRFIEVDENGNLIDIRTGLPVDPDDDLLTFNNSSNLVDRLNFTFAGSRGRNNYSLNAFAIQRSESTDITTNENTYGVSGNFSRQLRRLVSGNVFMSFRTTDFDTADGRTDDTYIARTGLSYTLAPDLTGSLQYTFTRRDSNIAANDLMENALTVRFRKTF